MASSESNPITVRRANPDDLPVLLGFEQQIISAERPFDNTLKDGHINYYDIRQLILSPDAEVAVAELDGELIGSGYARIENSKPYYKSDQHVYLGFMYVKPGQRGKSVNKSIIEWLQQWALAKGISAFKLEVYQTNLSAVRAYEKAGFKPALLEMRLDLPIKDPDPI